MPTILFTNSELKIGDKRVIKSMSSHPLCKKKKSRRERIIEMFSKPHVKLTCQQITKVIAEQDELTDADNRKRYLSGSISSILNILVKKNVLMYSDSKTGRGGYIYQLFKEVN